MDTHETAAFVEALWGDGPEVGHLLVWTARDKRSFWYASSDGVTARERLVADAQKWGEVDTYIGCGAGKKDYGSTRRARADQIAAIPGLWADLDLAGPGHKKKNLPETEEQALGILASCGLEPSIIVHSGGGIQAWWLFTEPLDCGDAAGIERAKNLTLGWHNVISQHARVKGYVVDATHDLARVMRLPGTANCKIPDQPRPVCIRRIDPRKRYSPDHFEALFVGSPEKERSAVKSVAVDNVSVKSDAEVGSERFQALLDLDPKIRATWERKRKDFTDQSASSYCFSLALFCVGAGWADQEIADLLVQWRRKHSEDLKIDRPDWYRLTIRNAKEKSAVTQAQALLVEMSEELDRAAVMKTLSQLLRVEVEDVYQLGTGHTASFFLRLLGGRVVDVGSIRDFFCPSSWRNAIAVSCRVAVPWEVMSNKAWHAIVEHRLLPVLRVEEEDDGDVVAEATVALEQYLDRRKLTYRGSKDGGRAIKAGYPITDGARLWITTRDFGQCLDLGQAGGDQRLRAHARNALKALGFVSGALSVPGTRTSRGYYSAATGGLLAALPGVVERCHETAMSGRGAGEVESWGGDSGGDRAPESP